MKRLVSFGFVALVVASACAPPARVSTPARAAVVPYHAVEWNVGHAAKGPFRAVIDGGDEIVALGEASATVFADGAVVAGDLRAAKWVSAATIAAPDRSGEWLLGIDAGGSLFRLRARTSFESVSARLGVEGAKVRAAVAVGGPESAFVTDDGFVLSDGERVKRYPLDGKGPIVALAGGSYVAVLVHPHETTVVHTKPVDVKRYELDAVAAAVDAGGRVALATRRGVYLAGDGDEGLSLVYAGEHVHGLARSADRVYFADGEQLFVLDRRGVSLAANVSVAPDARLLGSPSGDGARGRRARAVRGGGTEQRSERGNRSHLCRHDSSARRSSMCPLPCRRGRDGDRVDDGGRPPRAARSRAPTCLGR